MFKEIYQLLKEMFILRKAAISLSIAITLANMKQRAYNRQYIVYPMHNGKLKIFCRKEIIVLQRINAYSRKQCNRWRESSIKTLNIMLSDNQKAFDSNTITIRAFEKVKSDILDKLRKVEREYEKMLHIKLIDKDTSWDWFKRNAYYTTPLSFNNTNEYTPAQRKEMRRQWLKDFKILRERRKIA